MPAQTTAVFGRPDGVGGAFDSSASAAAATAGRVEGGAPAAAGAAGPRPAAAAAADAAGVDDGSQPSLRETVCAFNDPRIRFFRLESNRGVHAARAYAIEQTTGEFVAILDDDDCWFKEKLSTQLPVILHLSLIHI